MIGLSEVVVAAVGASIIAAVASLLGLFISRESKISEFRQAWIDALRSEVARLIAHVNAIHATTLAGFKDSREAWSAARPDLVGLNEAAALIRLRLKSEEADAEAVLAKIAALEQMLSPNAKMTHNEINRVEKELVQAAQIVMNREWRRVKRGEYRVFIALAAAIGVIALLVWIWTMGPQGG